ncbi:localization factor PodJL [Rhodopseudomonas rhenobacensis]|uniref:Localization factor PodJL n=1 Tax=Rhodopseudomonas rhenobacensis TaxID=87461 RepID=A0A7W7Z7J8_9BRAD|nr:SEL1-like repeat protein [Rhodopseudomonas rhenobacensis]MBB5049463.1 localization factor PodJL [Rhodopseudomonas rhenobacensis]
MNSRVSWSVEGIEPSVRERAEAAARRAGLSLGDWISAQVGDVPPQLRPQNAAQPAPALPEKDAQEVAEIHQRLDSITRQIEQISRPAGRGEPGVARQLNDAISRLDARLSQITDPARRAEPQPQPQLDRVERAAADVYRASPPLSPASLDSAIAEIAARQTQLDAAANELTPRRAAPPLAPAMPTGPAMAPAMPAAPDMSGLERQLHKITTQIDALTRPDAIEQSIAAFRGELAEIRQTITEAMPRRAIESLESEIRSLAKRIDDSRHNGIDHNALAGVERALAEIRDVLRSLTPAEQLAGFDEAIRNLGGKIDMIVRSSGDPSTLQQLEGAIAALRAIVANVASNEALARLSDDVQTLSSKVDQLARADSHSDSFAALEQRIAALTLTLENRERPVQSDPSAQLETALLALSDRLDRLPVGNDGAATFAHLEQRVTYLLERLEASAETRSPNLGRVEEGLQDVLRQLERQQDTFAALTAVSRTTPPDNGLADTLKREISDLRFTQTEADRHTQDSLEAVHNTLGHVVDRLAMIEGDLRSARPAPPSQPAMPAAARLPVEPPAPQVVLPPRPELPNPAAAAAHFDAAPRQFAAAPPAAEPAAPTPAKTIKEILSPKPARDSAAVAPAPEKAEPPQGVSRLSIGQELPPDHPLEPGTRPLRASPSERIAASESAISEIPAQSREQTSSSNFIAAARRAAQAAAAATQTPDKAKPAAKAAKAPKPAKPATSGAAAPAEGASTLGAKIRSLLVGASVVVIVLGTFKMAMNLLDGGAPQPAAIESAEPAPTPAPSSSETAPAPAAPANPSMTSPTPIGRQSLFGPAPAAPTDSRSADADITGTIPTPPPAIPTAPPSGRAASLVAIPANEKLPDAIGGPQLRIAALKGDPAAAYEIGVRYAEGKTVPANIDEAAKWYERAAQAGIVPAIFRVGTLYEKGLSVKRDLGAARRYYILAAERGNAKAMHNLAVLEADGGSQGANYKSASQWFRKAAERGVADSQFNLGILYARGIGVEQNLAESYKWFSLAAAQGDADAGRKRDDIAKRLDPQSLSAAKLAIQTFMPEPQPDDAINVASPPGGWDGAGSAAAKPAAAAKRAAR